MKPIKLSKEEELYIKEILNASIESNGRWPSRREMLLRTHDQLPKDFDPLSIDERVLFKGYCPTLLAIYLVEPESMLLHLFDKIMKEVKALLEKKKDVRKILSVDFQFLNSLKSTIRTQFWHILSQEIGHGGTFNSMQFEVHIHQIESTRKILNYKSLEEYIQSRIIEIENGNSINPLKTVNNLLNKLDNCIKLCEEGLLRSDEFREITGKIRSNLSEILEPNSIIGRKFEKHDKQPEWLEETAGRSGFVLSSACQYLLNWQNLLNEIIEFYEVEQSNSTQIEKEKFISSGKSYSGIKEIHKILKSAKKEIAIQDNYLDETIFDLLESTHKDIQIKLMGKKARGAFYQYLKRFADEKNANVAFRRNTECHCRFIIIDNTTVFHLGASIKDTGDKACMINLVESKAEREKVISAFDEWWSEGNDN